MDVIFIILPLAILMGGIAVTAFLLAAKRGQFDDLDTPPLRALFDDEAPHSGQCGGRVAREIAAASPSANSRSVPINTLRRPADVNIRNS